MNRETRVRFRVVPGACLNMHPDVMPLGKAVYTTFLTPPRCVGQAHVVGPATPAAAVAAKIQFHLLLGATPPGPGNSGRDKPPISASWKRRGPNFCACSIHLGERFLSGGEPMGQEVTECPQRNKNHQMGFSPFKGAHPSLFGASIRSCTPSNLATVSGVE
ncbi:hypothetical protein Bbelb_284480 [Branchiostoma belcheri]|nr:hypothetical protein Bbelb_284480 [Branchiostoma belcheri]